MGVPEFQPRQFESPSPDSIANLAAVALDTASSLNKVITPGFANGKAKFFCHRDGSEVDSLDEFDRRVVGFMVSRDALAKPDVDDFIDRDPSLPLNRFRIKDTYFSQAGSNRGLRYEYHFAWDETRVYSSTKETTMLPIPIASPQLSLNSLYNWLRNNPLEIGLLEEELSLASVDSSQFDELARDMTSYFESLKIR